MEEVLITPMSLVGMTTYHTKNIPNNIGSSYGLLYALQEELSYKITITAPLGTNLVPVNKLIERMVDYQILRLRKGKNNMNYYEQFILIGWYAMTSEKTLNEQITKELRKAFEERGSPYSLINFVNLQTINPKLYKANQQVKYKMEFDTLQKYCVDALNMQSNKNQSVYVTTLSKERHLIGTYDDKLQKLTTLLQKTKDEEKKRQILHILEIYDRIESQSQLQKQKTIQAINYSVLTGLILTYQNDIKS